MSQVIDYIDKNKDHFLAKLKELIRVESISTQPSKRDEVLKCAESEAKLFKEIGLENVELLQTSGYPLVYGDWLHAKGRPTVLVYGHYDVQPPDPLDEWQSPPFEPTIRNGNLYGRGTSDNKAQHFTHLGAIEAYLKTIQKLPINMKVVLEGEEESGSKGITDFLHSRGEKLACDAVLISDSPWFDYEHPAIAYSLKGLVYFEIKVKGPGHDLHSGLFGGMIRNPLQVLSWILSRLKDENERILIPEFYQDVQTITEQTRKDIASLPSQETALLKETGVSHLISEKDFTPLETNWTRPTLDICGMWGGYQAAGAKTIIPAEAGAKVSIRIVANQDPKKVAKQFSDYVKSLCPKETTVEVNLFKGASAVYVDRDHPYLEKVARAYEKGFGKKVIFKREGASIPVCETFQEVLKAPLILIGLGLPDDRLHSPNEKISLSNFFGGIKGAALAYQALGEGS